MGAYSNKKAKEIFELVEKVGNIEAGVQLGIKTASVRRAVIYYKNTLHPEEKVKDFNPNATLKKIQELYSEKELQAIANGGRILPGLEKVPIISFEGKHIKIGVLTDTHIGHQKFSEDRLFQAFEEFRKEKVDFITHSGDVCEAMSHRPGHIYELDQLGYEQQKEYAIKLFSQWTDTDIYAIDGNHDRWFIKSNGAYVVKDIDRRLENFHFIGHDEGDISLDGRATLKLWHGEDGNCFDEGTEILTKDGFVDFKDLTKEHEVATMSKEDHIFEWQNPTHITNEHYEGKMLNFKHRSFNFNVTPKHGLWAEFNKSLQTRKETLTHPTKSHQRLRDDWFRIEAQDLSDDYRKQRYRIPNSVNGFKDNNDLEYISISRMESKNKGTAERMVHLGEVKIELIAKLIAWYVTEGHACKSAIQLSQFKNKNPENHAEIVELAKSLNLNYTETDRAITLHSLELAEWLKEVCGHKSHNKFLPDFIKESKKEILEDVLAIVIKGDGWEKKGGSLGYVSKSKRLSEDVGLIALKLGYAVNYGQTHYVTKVNHLKGTIHTTHISNVQKNPSINSKPTEFDYNGQIYCCEVPNGLIYVRRNGKCFWSHNSYALSYRIQKIIESFSGGEKPSILLAGHTHKYVKVFERNITAISAGCIEAQTSWMRGKRIAAAVGFVILDVWVGDKGITKIGDMWYPFYV